MRNPQRWTSVKGKGIRALLVTAALLLTFAGKAQKHSTLEYLTVIQSHFNSVRIALTPTDCDPVITELTRGRSPACATIFTDEMDARGAIDDLLGTAINVIPLTSWLRTEGGWHSRAYITTYGDYLTLYLHRGSALLTIELIVTVVGNE